MPWTYRGEELEDEPADRNRSHEPPGDRASCASLERCAKLSAHLDAQDVCEANDRAARRHLNDTHIAEAVAMVQENVQDRIEDGRIPKELGDMLLALFERIEAVAIEASWADLAREACDD
jgi:hypothetical protein